jgi:hypothetical protein
MLQVGFQHDFADFSKPNIELNMKNMRDKQRKLSV